MSLEMLRVQNYAFNLLNCLVGYSNIRLFEFMIDWRLTVAFEKNTREYGVNHFSIVIPIWEVRAVRKNSCFRWYLRIYRPSYNSMGPADMEKMINWTQKTLFIWFKTRQRKLCAVCDWENKEWASQGIVGAWVRRTTAGVPLMFATSQLWTLDFHKKAQKFRFKIKNSKWYRREARRRKDVVEHPAFMHST